MPSVTLNFTAANATRIQDAIKETLNPLGEDLLPRDATVADLKEYLIKDIKQFVRSSERRVVARLANGSVNDVNLT